MVEPTAETNNVAQEKTSRKTSSSREEDTEFRKSLTQKIKENVVINKTTEAAKKVTVEAKKTGYFKAHNFVFLIVMAFLFIAGYYLSVKIKRKIYG